jgi:GNAT superfamily N-acetyltransferase
VAAVCLYDLSKDGAEVIPGYMLLKVYSDGISLIDFAILPEFRRRGLASAAISRVKKFLELTDGGYLTWHCPSESVATAAVGLMLANEFSFQASVTGPTFTWSRKRAVPRQHKSSAKLFAEFVGRHGDDSTFDEIAAAMDRVCPKASDPAPTDS